MHLLLYPPGCRNKVISSLVRLHGPTSFQRRLSAPQSQLLIFRVRWRETVSRG